MPARPAHTACTHTPCPEPHGPPRRDPRPRVCTVSSKQETPSHLHAPPPSLPPTNPTTPQPSLFLHLRAPPPSPSHEARPPPPPPQSCCTGRPEASRGRACHGRGNAGQQQASGGGTAGRDPRQVLPTHQAAQPSARLTSTFILPALKSCSTASFSSGRSWPCSRPQSASANTPSATRRSRSSVAALTSSWERRGQGTTERGRLKSTVQQTRPLRSRRWLWPACGGQRVEVRNRTGCTTAPVVGEG